MFHSEHVKVNGHSVFKVITTLEMTAKMNHHGILVVEGMIQDPGEIQISDILSLEYHSDDNDVVNLFQGYIIKLEIQFENQAYYLTATCISGTYQFDQDIKKQSFQNVGMTFGELTRKVAGKKRAVIVPEKAHNSIERFWVQYEETDWEFLKRIAGYLHTVLIPEITNSFPQCSLGKVKGKSYVIESCEEYTSKIDYEAYRYKRCKVNCNLYDFLKITFEWGKNYNLGDNVMFLKQSKMITTKKVLLKQGMLRFFYELYTETAAGLSNFKSSKLAGNSLKGVVVIREKEQVGLLLDIDKEQSEKASMLFDYVPITGNIMYAIPEVGSKVALYFPDGDESKAMAVECILDGKAGLKPSKKHLMTIEEKSIEMTPYSLRFFTKGQVMDLSDEDGINLESEKKISLIAEANISIKSTGIVFGETEDSMIFENVSSGERVELSGNEINMHSDQIMFSGRSRPKKKRKERSPADGMDAIGRFTGKIVAGVPKNSSSLLDRMLCGGVPMYLEPKRINNLSELIGIREDS